MMLGRRTNTVAGTWTQVKGKLHGKYTMLKKNKHTGTFGGMALNLWGLEAF